MKLYVDKDNCIRAVGSTDDPTLTELIVDETAENFPFKDMSTARICCYKISVMDGNIVGFTPYIDSRNLDMIDKLGKLVDETKKKNMALEQRADDVDTTIEDLMTNVIPELMGLAE